MKTVPGKSFCRDYFAHLVVIASWLSFQETFFDDQMDVFDFDRSRRSSQAAGVTPSTQQPKNLTPGGEVHKSKTRCTNIYSLSFSLSLSLSLFPHFFIIYLTNSCLFNIFGQ